MYKGVTAVDVHDEHELTFSGRGAQNLGSQALKAFLFWAACSLFLLT